MFFANQSINDQVIKELHLGDEQLTDFTQPRSLYQYFCRAINTEMNVSQLHLFDAVSQYTDEDNHTNKKRYSLIMRLEAIPNFQGISYIEIWCKLRDVAHCPILHGIKKMPCPLGHYIFNMKYTSLHINFTLTSEKR